MRLHPSFKVHFARLRGHWSLVIGHGSLLLCLAALCQLPAGAAQPSVDLPAHLSEFALVKSEFSDDINFGKDPFYPRSTRRHGQRPIATNPVIHQDPQTPDLVLNGISGSRARPLAILNFRTFAVGETAEMRIKNQIVKVQLIEINDKVVKVTVNGVPKELPRPQR